MAIKGGRAKQTDNEVVRTQKDHDRAKPKAVQVTVWVSPVIKAELVRLAVQEGLSISATGAAFLERALQRNIDLEYSALLKPIIEQTIAHEMRGIATRLVWLLVRISFDAGQTRSMVTNILGRQPGMSQDLLKTILIESGKTAKSNITRRTPQIRELVEAIEQWLIAEDPAERQERI